MNLIQNLAPHPNNGYTLDLLFTPAGLVTPLDFHEQLPTTDIHHLSTFCEIQDVNSTNFSPTTFKRNFRNADYESIISTLLSMNWNSVLYHEDLNHNLNKFYKVFDSVIEIHVPLTTEFSSSYPKWYDLELKRAIQDKKCVVRTADGIFLRRYLILLNLND